MNNSQWTGFLDSSTRKKANVCVYSVTRRKLEMHQSSRSFVLLGDLEIDNLEDTAHRLANTVVFAEANDLPNQARLSLKLEGLCRR